MLILDATSGSVKSDDRLLVARSQKPRARRETLVIVLVVFLPPSPSLHPSAQLGRVLFKSVSRVKTLVKPRG
jgi:hypothetical protein